MWSISAAPDTRAWMAVWDLNIPERALGRGRCGVGNRRRLLRGQFDSDPACNRAVGLTGIVAEALEGTPTNATLASANAGQIITLTGFGFSTRPPASSSAEWPLDGNPRPDRGASGLGRDRWNLR